MEFVLLVFDLAPLMPLVLLLLLLLFPLPVTKFNNVDDAAALFHVDSGTVAMAVAVLELEFTVIQEKEEKNYKMYYSDEKFGSSDSNPKTKDGVYSCIFCVTRLSTTDRNER